LAYIFGRLREGEAFSTVVRRAREAGYTEPHPRDDLSGLDVARKLLILLRAWGVEVEPSDIPVEGLVPDRLAGEQDPEVFLAGLHGEDARWRRRLAEAREGGGTLIYAASFEDGVGRVGVRTVPRDHPLAGLEGTENRVLLTTDRFTPVPLTVSGPGAGVEITATGVLADILEVARR
jgi:aspartokinase/homoserine dehydrogenase 1